MDHVAKLLSEVETGNNIIFRGHANASWELKPSIGRHYIGPWRGVAQKEVTALENFKKRSIPYLKHVPTSDIEWLCLMQHHGCATRLLDFTTNPLIALFFATNSMLKNDGALVVARYGRIYENVSNEELFNRKQNFVYHPPHITERIIGQNGCFVYSHTPNKPLNDKKISQISVSSKNKINIQGELKELGITHSSLFPGLDGICNDLNLELVRNLEDENFEYILS